MDVNYEFSIDDIIECVSNGIVYRLKKVDVLDVMRMKDDDEFRTFDGFRIVKDIIQIDYIIWPSKLEYTSNGAPRYTNYDSRTFRITYLITGGYFAEVKSARMTIDDLPSKIRDMKVNRVLGVDGEDLYSDIV